MLRDIEIYWDLLRYIYIYIYIYLYLWGGFYSLTHWPAPCQALVLLPPARCVDAVIFPRARHGGMIWGYPHWWKQPHGELSRVHLPSKFIQKIKPVSHLRLCVSLRSLPWESINGHIFRRSEFDLDASGWKRCLPLWTNTKMSIS